MAKRRRRRIKRKRKLTAYQRCMRRKLKGKKVTRSLFRKAAKACARKTPKKRRRRRRRR